MLPARLRSDVGHAKPRARAFPGFTAYQDGFSRLIASETTFVTGLAALAGLHGWPSAAAAPRRRLRALHSRRAGGLGAARCVGGRRCRPWSERLRASFAPAAGSASGPTRPAVPYGLGVHLELALLARAGIANDQVLRMATAGRRARARARARDRHARGGKARGLRGPRRRSAGAHRGYAADRRRRQGRRLAGPILAAGAAVMSDVFTRSPRRRLRGASRGLKFAQPLRNSRLSGWDSFTTRA